MQFKVSLAAYFTQHVDFDPLHLILGPFSCFIYLMNNGTNE